MVEKKAKQAAEKKPSAERRVIEIGKVRTDIIVQKMKKLKIRQYSMADSIGCTLVTLNRKLNGNTPFTVPEMSALLDVLNITDPDEICEICGIRAELNETD